MKSGKHHSCGKGEGKVQQVVGAGRYSPLGGEELLLLDYSNLTTTQLYQQFLGSDVREAYDAVVL